MAANGPIVCKFGGTSVKDAPAVLHIKSNILPADPKRIGIVVSTPAGITEELIKWCNAEETNRTAILSAIVARFEDLVVGLDVNDHFDIGAMFGDIKKNACRLEKDVGRDVAHHYMRSRGEWINAQIVAKAFGFEFIDTAAFIKFNAKGKFSMRLTRKAAREIGLRHHANGIVFPGYYGSMPDGSIRTFSRGGSDLSGAIVAVLLEASVYENWTDVPGVMTAHPKVVTRARMIEYTTFEELLELAYTGAKVFHPDAVRPVAEAGIPVHVRCTTNAQNGGTWIVPDVAPIRGTITGMAHRDGFSHIKLKKMGMNTERGFDNRLNKVLLRFGINFHHKQTGTDQMTVVVPTDDIGQRHEKLTQALKRHCRVDSAKIDDGFTVICFVGRGMAGAIGTAGRLFTSIGNAGVSIKTVDQGASEINIVTSVLESDAQRAMEAVHYDFIG